MNDKPYTKKGNTYFPQKKTPIITEDQISGAYWKAWRQEDKILFEYDSGHFMTQFETVGITEEEFSGLKNGTIPHFDLIHKYRN